MSKIPFRPVKGTEEQIANIPISSGQFYCATDTGKIYLDAKGKRISMGGSGVSIYYGSITGLEPDNETDFYYFPKESLENDKQTPKIDDIILNVNDGKFFRVLDILEDTYECMLLLVSGSGEGPTQIFKPKLVVETPPENMVNGQSLRIYFTATSAKDENNDILDNRLTITYTLSEVIDKNTVTQYYTGTKSVISGERNFIEITNLRESKQTEIAIYANGSNHTKPSSTSRSTVTTSTLTLSYPFGFSYTTRYSPNTVVLSCDVVGNLPKILDFYFDDDSTPKQTMILKNDQVGTFTYSVPSNLCMHGNHKVKIELYFNSGSIDEPIRNKDVQIEPLEYEIAVVENSNINPIIWFGTYKKLYYNYDTITIPYMIYNPQNVTEAVVHLYKNNVEFQELTITDMQSFNYWDIADAELGENFYAISCGTTRRDVNFKVEQDPNRNMEIVKQENLIFNFNPTGRSNSESLSKRNSYQFNDIIGVLENFNWYNNGWLKDSNNQACLRISNGASFSVPLNLGFGYQDSSRRSNSIEIEFKVSNIQKYSNLITNITRYKYKKNPEDTYYTMDDEWYQNFLVQDKYTNYDDYLQKTLDANIYDSLEFSSLQKNIDLKNVICGFYTGTQEKNDIVGICIGTQDTFFTNGTNTVNVSFVEDEIINLSFVYEVSSTGPKMLIYINGDITGVIHSTKTGFGIGTNLVFKSDTCDIDLYRLRVYNTNLLVNDICQNYAVDRKDIITFDQNGLAILNENLEEYQLSYTSVMNYNEAHPEAPLMPYLIFDTSWSSSNTTDKLPWMKSMGAIPVKLTFVNTMLDAAYQQGRLEELAIKDGLISALDANNNKEKLAEAVKTYYRHHCPSFVSYLKDDNEGVISLTLQGTSSQFYPRKNFKGKTKMEISWLENDEQGNPIKKTGKALNIFLNRGPYASIYQADKAKVENDNPAKPYYGNEECRMTNGWYLNNYTNATDRWTFKVDYMESSGSYNAGFANMVGSTYSKHPLEDYLNKNAIVDTKNKLLPVSGPATEIRWEDYRTSMQGFPVMAFQKVHKGNSAEDKYIFIGYYRMLTDKGSDAIIGFKPDKGVEAKLVKDAKGKNKKVRDVAECWEFSNNSRTYCSFRDPENRVKLSFKRSANSDNEFNANMAPSIIDSFEYRYHKAADQLDQLYEFSNQSQETLNDMMVTIRKDLGLAEDAYSLTAIQDKNNLTDEDKQHAREAADVLLMYYANWEKACQWIWSTNVDNVPSQGTYSEVKLGKQNYVANKFYIQSKETGKYTLATENEAIEGNTYYETYTDDNGIIRYRDAHVCMPGEKVYISGQYYIKEIVQDKERYNLATGSYDFTFTYYEFQQLSEEQLAATADLLVAPATGIFTTDKVYYLYDGTKTINAKGQTGSVIKVENPQENDFVNYYEAKPVTYGNVTYKYDTKEYRRAKFTNELNEHFDPEYLATYFIMTEVFECYDSRGKNCMMASWGPLEENGNYIWYPIFYDIDTQLGINNSGLPSFEFNIDVTDQSSFSTSDSVLWNNFYTYYKGSYILSKYQQLRGIKTDATAWWGKVNNPPLTSVDNIEKWYNFDPDVTNNIACEGYRPLVADNLDMYYKYITITNPKAVANGVGYLEGVDGEMVYDTKDTYFYALQGDRRQSRRQFLINRLEYIDSWLNQGNYARGGKNLIYGRIASNDMTKKKLSDHWIETDNDPYWKDNKEFGEKTHEFDAQYWVDLTPIRSSYVTIGGDGDFTYPSRKYDGINTVRFKISEIEQGFRKSPNYPEQLIYLYGMNQMRDLGELNNLYWAEFTMSGNFDKLTRLQLGYDAGNDSNGTPFWFNYGLNKIDLQPMPLLKEMNISNIHLSTEKTLDLTKSEKLETFKGINTQGVTDINFADGVALSTLYLPSEVTELKLIEANLLTNLIKEITDSNGILVEKGLYLEGFFDKNNVSKLNTINIRGSSLKTASYEILKQFYNKYKDSTSAAKVTIQDADWCPLTLVGIGELYNSEKTYYKDNGHYGFSTFDNATDNFNQLIANGELYCGTIPKDYIIDDDAFTILKGLQDVTKYFQSASNEENSKPYISGTIYINNTNPVEESEVYGLQDKYPKLTFFFANINKAYSAKFVSYDEESKAYKYVKFKDANITKPSVQKISVQAYKEGKVSFDNPIGLYDPQRTHYDFKGWCSNPDGSGILYTDSWDETITENIYDYTYYAIYTVHKYVMTFYQGDGEEPVKIEVPYNQKLTTPNTIPYKDDSTLGLYEAYNFIGYSTVENSTEIMNITSMVAISDRNFYAVFKKVNDIRDIIHPEWFEYADTSWNSDSQFIEIDNYFSNVTDRVPQPPITSTIYGCAIRPKTGLTLQGKITLPNEATYINSKGQQVTKPVIAIGFGLGLEIDDEFFANEKPESNNHKITHIFFQKSGSNVLCVSNNAFKGNTTMKYFDFTPNTIREVRKSAFMNCHLDAQLYDKLNQGLSEKLYLVGEEAFLTAFISSNGNITLRLPGSLRYIGQSAFMTQLISKGWTFQLGSKTSPSMVSYKRFRELYPSNYPDTMFSSNWGYTGQAFDEGIKNFVIYDNRYSRYDEEVEGHQLYEYFVRTWDPNQTLDKFTFTFYKGEN